MPELPEVECLRRSLEPHLLGRRILRADLRRADICTASRALPRSTSPARMLLEGGTILALHRLGKHLALEADDGRVMEIHLGMSGQVRVHTTPDAAIDRHVHAVWMLEPDHRQATTMTFRDPRRFGGLWTFPSLRMLHEERWSVLGPDALSIDATDLAAKLRRTTRAIKTALLDQAILAGVGNIYADEALFQARLHPCRPSHRLNPSEVERLAGIIRTTLAAAIASKGSTLRDYADADGQTGESQFQHHVYGRGSQPCTRCALPLRVITLAQRTTTYCPTCQPRTPGKRSARHQSAQI